MRRSITVALACSLTAVLSFATAACDAPTAPPTSGNTGASGGQGGSGNLATGGRVITIATGTGGQPGPLFAGQVERNAAALPVSGGTLLITRDGTKAIAADPERAQIFLVDLPSRAVRAVNIEPGDEPGRVAEGPSGVAYVLARRGGAVLVIDLALGTLRERIPVCAAPRGLAFDARANAIHVACRSGRLVTLDASTLALTRTLNLDPDLRDVLVRGNELVLTRFQSSELLVLDAQGTLLRRAVPAPQRGCATATVAYRAVLTQDSDVLLVHQASSNTAVGVSQGGYGASCGGALVNAFMTLASVDGPGETSPVDATPQDPIDSPVSPIAFRSARLSAAGTLDVAVSNTGDIAVLGNIKTAFGAAAVGVASLQKDAAGLATLPTSEFLPRQVDGDPVAVAFDANDHYVVQSRQPAQLSFMDGSRLLLSDESRADTGQAMFQMSTGVGIACASCHPEGDEDGHLWHFTFGLRRTQPLQGGVLSRAPFHWNGELAQMTDLVSEVMVKRMALQQLPTFDQVDALAGFLDGIQFTPGVDDIDLEAAARGAQLFADPVVGCASCHSGQQFTDNQLHDVGTGGPFSTPTLLGVGLRGALFHDGCAPTLSARFGACGGGDNHGSVSHLSTKQLGDLVAYLKSL